MARSSSLSPLCLVIVSTLVAALFPAIKATPIKNLLSCNYEYLYPLTVYSFCPLGVTHTRLSCLFGGGIGSGNVKKVINTGAIACRATSSLSGTAYPLSRCCDRSDDGYYQAAKYSPGRWYTATKADVQLLRCPSNNVVNGGYPQCVYGSFSPIAVAKFGADNNLFKNFTYTMV